MVDDAVRLWRFVFYPTLIDNADYGQLDCCKKNLKFDWCKHKQPMVGILHLFFPVNIRCQRWSDTWGPDILLNVRRRWCENQWPFQEPKLEVPTIYKAYVRPM